MPEAARLLGTSAALAGVDVDLVAIDMRLSRDAISGRREYDNAVSGAYGGRKCSMHTPSSHRPGAISNVLRASF